MAFYKYIRRKIRHSLRLLRSPLLRAILLRIISPPIQLLPHICNPTIRIAISVVPNGVLPPSGLWREADSVDNQSLSSCSIPTGDIRFNAAKWRRAAYFR